MYTDESPRPGDLIGTSQKRAAGPQRRERTLKNMLLIASQPWMQKAMTDVSSATARGKRRG
jgi:hypothetical protein